MSHARCSVIHWGSLQASGSSPTPESHHQRSARQRVILLSWRLRGEWSWDFTVVWRSQSTVSAASSLLQRPSRLMNQTLSMLVKCEEICKTFLETKII
ncbi:unnamed protein product [Microthlaspi erraticum]|uniref:Uncharacterized protein n=1 Tax=Microthlaspi erraticum TaxID=1685480 RepID=A0A6D2K6L6_9BRAS|nr:unnamed protein product [Microthlaspi erraticum]